jgi:hypothetical protein
MMCRKQLTDFKNSTLVTLLKLLPEKLIAKNGHNRSEHTIKLVNGSVIIYKGLGNAEEVEAIRSLEVSSIMIDEATEVPKEGFLMCQQRIQRWKLPTGEYPPAYVLLASNPDDGWVKEMFIDNPGEDFTFIQALPTDNPHLHEDYIPSLRRNYPEEWVQRFLEGDWNAMSGDDKVIPYEFIRAAVNRKVEIIEKPIVSCDPAAFGDDETVIYYGKGNILLKQDCHHKQDPMVTVGRILRMMKDNRAERCIIEQDGLGVGIVSAAKQAGLKTVPFKSGENAHNKEKYFKMKSEAWFYVRDCFMDGTVSIPNDPKLINQLASIRYTVRGSGGQLWVEPKDKYKQRVGKSPDRADALMLMLWGAKSMRDPNRGFDRVPRGRTLDLQGKGNTNSYGWSYEPQGV